MSAAQKNLARRSGLAIAGLCLLLFVSTAHAQTLPGYQPPDKGKPANELSIGQKAAQGKAPLAKIYGHLKPDANKIKRLPTLEQREKRKKSDKRFQVGVTRALSVALNPLTDSALYSVAEGDVRVAEVVSTGAFYTRLHFRRMSLPTGARVFVYSASDPDQYAGPYENHGPAEDGTFWTPPLPGDTLIVEYFTPAGTQSTDVPFKVSEVSHVYKDAFMSDAAGSCNLDVTSDWATVAKSVGMLDFVSGGAEFLCTGNLLNDSAQDQRPYLLTANHCISSQSEAQSLTVYWNYLTGDFPPGGTQTTHGANLLVTGTASDFSLLLLTGSVPTANLFFSGWDASPVSASVAVTGIHHPSGSHKRISFGATNANCAGNLPGPCQNFAGVTWSQGVTEPGSSGSGIWTGNPAGNHPENALLVGQLYGGDSACDMPTASDYYGRFSVTYPNIAGFLSGSCVTSASPLNQSFPASGGSGSINVSAPGGCNWTATATDAFVTITGGSSGSGDGTVNFQVSANPNGFVRNASIVVGSQVVTITQLRKSSGSCTPGAISLNQTINGNLQPGCPLGDGTYVDAYNFNANAGQQVIVSMSSGVFDTYLYLLNTDGTVLAINDDNGGSTNSRIPPGTAALTLPNTGTYTILANSFDPATGAYTLTLSTPRTLTVASSNPNSGVTVAVNPTDTNGLSGNGTTQFTRSYAPGVTATLVAASSAGPNTIFQKWQKDGVDWSSTTVTNVTMDTDHTLTAFYRPLNDYVLTVDSSPVGGVNIAISTNDGGDNGTTKFTRTYKENTSVFLTAAQTAPNGYVFQKWQKDGVDVPGNQMFATVTMNAAHSMTAVYVPPVASTMTVNTSNPSSGVTITVSPTDNNGASDGVAPFTRTYFQTTQVTLTAPATAPNGNIFDRWLMNLNGNGNNNWSFSRTTTVTFGTQPFTMTAVYLTTPNVFTETSTNNAAAVNSVTLLRGPFQILDSRNFSADGHTRIILFTSDLGLPQGPNQPAYQLAVTVQGFGSPLDIEAVGPVTGVPGLTGTYIVVRLPDGLPTGALQMTLLFHGVGGNTTTLNIAP